MFVLGVCLLSISSAKVPGSVAIDSLTFDRIVDGSRDVLVKFDKSYAYGDKEDAFKEVAKTVSGMKNDFLIADVGVEEYGDKENDDVRERFGINKDDFPVFKLFKKGGDPTKPVDFTGDVTKEGLTQFLKVEGGLYIALPGNIEAFDKITKGLLSLDKAGMEGKLKQAKTAQASARDDEKDYAKFYVKTITKLLEKGDGHIETEMKRIKKLQDSKLSDKKKKMFSDRLNILASFTKTEL